jgi:mannosyl-oligosaccharide glucosidase
MYDEGDNDLTYTLGPRGGVESISGHAHEIGHFKLDFSTLSKGAEYGHLATDLNKLSLFSEFVKSVMTDTRQMKLSGERYMFGSKRTRLIIHQVQYV